ncbi:hypothetical protein ACIRD3_11395 [Kitasatospora sp. NPDC093550]|uniref:hypothetical protein n=1 Tax=Kitasatospora sp. NPDC093550 TaxID=3364089 RepID=UPI00380221AD
MTGLPPIGAEIPCSSLAVDTPLRLGTQAMSVDFRGGLKHRVDVNPDDPINSVRMRLVGLRYSAEIPSDNGSGGGTLTLEQNDVDVDPKGLLKLTQRFPPTYEYRIVMSPFVLTVDRPGDGEPQVLIPKGEVALVGRLTQFPPRGDLFQLEKPAELVHPDKPGDIVAVIEKFPAKVGGL